MVVVQNGARVGGVERGVRLAAEDARGSRQDRRGRHAAAAAVVASQRTQHTLYLRTQPRKQARRADARHCRNHRRCESHQRENAGCWAAQHLANCVERWGAWGGAAWGSANPVHNWANSGECTTQGPSPPQCSDPTSPDCRNMSSRRLRCALAPAEGSDTLAAACSELSVSTRSSCSWRFIAGDMVATVCAQGVGGWVGGWVHSAAQVAWGTRV